jgi:hypothetical protein
LLGPGVSGYLEPAVTQAFVANNSLI